MGPLERRRRRRGRLLATVCTLTATAVAGDPLGLEVYPADAVGPPFAAGSLPELEADPLLSDLSGESLMSVGSTATTKTAWTSTTTAWPSSTTEIDGSTGTSYAASVKKVEFVDEDGDISTLVVTDGHMRWCASKPKDFGCRRLQKIQLTLLKPCHFKVTFTELQGEAWYAVIADPPPGPSQRLLAKQLLYTARTSKVDITGNAVEELDVDGDDTALIDATVLSPPMTFPVPLTPQPKARTPFLLRPVGKWEGANFTGSCAVIVEHPEDCNSCAFSRDICVAQRLWHVDGSSGFEVPHPPFALASAAEHNHSVCSRSDGVVDPRLPRLALLGKLSYYPLPRVSFLAGAPRIGVRTFVNPGWHKQITLECQNCSQFNTIVVRPLPYDAQCKGLTQQTLAAAAAATLDNQMPEGGVDMRHHAESKLGDIVRQAGSGTSLSGLACKPPHDGPCGAYADDAFAVGLPTIDPAQSGKVTFTIEAEQRLLAKERRALFHHRSALCFYPGGGTPGGWLVGFVAVHMDGPDMQAFIGFVCFFGVALPLICLVTALLHYNKYERCKQHIHHVRLEYQREQLERELAARRGGGRNHGSSAGESSAPASQFSVGRVSQYTVSAVPARAPAVPTYHSSMRAGPGGILDAAAGSSSSSSSLLPPGGISEAAVYHNMI